MDRKSQRSPKIPHHLIWSAIVVLIGIAALPLFGADSRGVKEFDARIQQEFSRLDSIKTALERGRLKLRDLQKKEGSYLGQLSQLQENIGMSQTLITRLSAQTSEVQQSIDVLEQMLIVTRGELSGRQATMEHRWVAMYKTGSTPLPLVLLQSANIAEALYRVKYMQTLNQYDRRLLHTIDSSRVEIDHRKSTLLSRRATLVSLKKEKEAQQRSLIGEQHSQQVLLGDVRRQKDRYLAMIKDLEQAQSGLAKMIKELQEKRQKARKKTDKAYVGTTAFDKYKGKLPWPAKGQVVQSFGKVVHPVYKTVVMNTGIDIAISGTTTVTCVAAGRVLYVGSMRGYGNFVMVDHGDKYLTIYSQLARISIENNEDIAPSGVLGTAQGQVHFEIRRSTDPVDPEEWLRDK